MAFNIFERWPWTSFQNLNLDWLMKAVREAVTKADEAAASVGQFDERITTAETNSNEANTKAAEANTKAAEALNTANAASVTANNASDAANAASATASAASANATQAQTDAARALSEVGGAIGSYKIFVNAQNQCSHAGELIDAGDILSALVNGRNVFVERADPNNPYLHTGYQFAYYDIDNSTTPAPTTTVFFDRLISYAGENAIVERMYLVGSSNTAGFATIQTLASKSYVDSYGGGGGGLPAVTSADNGKFLRVVSGAWAAATVPAAESTSFGP